jgi:hypothetical protein
MTIAKAQEVKQERVWPGASAKALFAVGQDIQPAPHEATIKEMLTVRLICRPAESGWLLKHTLSRGLFLPYRRLSACVYRKINCRGLFDGLTRNLKKSDVKETVYVYSRSDHWRHGNYTGSRARVNNSDFVIYVLGWSDDSDLIIYVLGWLDDDRLELLTQLIALSKRMTSSRCSTGQREHDGKRKDEWSHHGHILPSALQ